MLGTVLCSPPNSGKDFQTTCFARRDFLWKLEMGLSSTFWDDMGGEIETLPMGPRGLKAKSMEFSEILRNP